MGTLPFPLPPAKALAGSCPKAMMNGENLFQGQLHWPGQMRPDSAVLTGRAGSVPTVLSV